MATSFGGGHLELSQRGVARCCWVDSTVRQYLGLEEGSRGNECMEGELSPRSYRRKYDSKLFEAV